MLFFLSLLGFACLFSTLNSKMRSGASLICAFSSMLALSYIGVVLLNDFVCTPYLLMYGGLLSLAGCIVFRYISQKKGKSFLPFFNQTTITYLIISFLFSVLVIGCQLKWHDEYSFWARAAKELFLFEKPYFNAHTNMLNRDYIPLFASLQVCIGKVFSWSNTALYAVIIACYACTISALVDLLKSTDKLKKALLALALVIAIPYSHVKFNFTYLSPDGPLAMLFATGLLTCIFRNNNKPTSFLPLLFILFILPGIKIYSGLMFAIVLFILLLVELKKANTQTPAPKKQHVCLILCALFMMLFVQLTWSAYSNFGFEKAHVEEQHLQQAYLNDAETADVQAPQFSLSMFFKGNERNQLLKDKHLATSQGDIKNALHFFLFAPSTSNIFPFSVYALYVLLMFVSLLLLSKQNRKRQFSVALYILIASICYIIGIMFTLLVQPDAYNSTNRYLAVLLLTLWVCFFFFLFRKKDGRDQKTVQIYLVLFAFVFLITANMPQIFMSFSKDVKGYKVADPIRHQKMPLIKKTLAAHLGEHFENVQKGDMEEKDAPRILVVDHTLDSVTTGEYASYAYIALPTRLTLSYHTEKDKVLQDVLNTRATHVIYVDQSENGFTISLYAVQIKDNMPTLLPL